MSTARPAPTAIRLPLPEGVAALSRRFDAAAFAPQPGLEEVCVAGASGVAAGIGFLLARQFADGLADRRRLVAFVAPRFWIGERGRPYGHGLERLGADPRRLLVATPATEADALWTLEEALRSGAVGLAIGTVEAASLTASRRLDLAAREAKSTVALVRTTAQNGLSAARRRWRLTPHPSAPDAFDPKASGPPRWRAELERSRDGAVGGAILEFDDETLRLGLVDGLADHRLAVEPAVATPPRPGLAA